MIHVVLVIRLAWRDQLERGIRLVRGDESILARCEAADGEEARAVASAAIKALGLGLDEEGLTEYLVFVGNDEIVAVPDMGSVRDELVSFLDPTAKSVNWKHS